MAKKKVALIDADGLVYATGAVSETVYYTIEDLRFDYKSQANEHADEIGLPRDAIERNVDAQPASHALNAIRTTVEAVIEQTQAEQVEIYLSNLDGDNFRNLIYPDYKKQRKHSERPVHFKAIRNWLLVSQNAIVTHGLEPDDLMAIRAQELTTLGTPFTIVTNDKDMMQIPGDHYNWSKHTFKTVKPWDAMYSLYTQILVGDSIDNVKGCPGIGPAKARTALKGATTEEELLDATFEAYKKAYSGDEAKAKELMVLNIKLVRLVTKRPEVQ